MKVAVLKETFPGETRVALIPANASQLAKVGLEIEVEAGAGQAAGFADSDYTDQGARVVSSREDLFSADIVLQVRSLGANLEAGRADLGLLKSSHFVVGMCDPLGEPQAIADIAETGASLFALEMIPRITRAQSMDVLSSMATIAGYRAVLLAATRLPKIFPMLTYAAGMLRPARVFVIGAGVAGLRAIATAKQLGAVVQGHDIRPTSREEVQSVGAKFVELKLDGDTQDAGGYAKQLTDADYQRQRELIADVAEESDAIITTAAIPGRRSPLLVTTAAVERMTAGSVIVDLAAERGGNCEVCQADQAVDHNGVLVLGPTNLVAEAPAHASDMYSNNLTKFLLNMVKDGQLELDLDDEIIRDTLVTREGEVVHPRIRQLLDLEPLPEPEPEAEPEPEPTPEGADTPPGEGAIPFDSVSYDADEKQSDEPAASEKSTDSDDGYMTLAFDDEKGSDESDESEPGAPKEGEK